MPPPTPTKKWINKKSATNFQVRYRSQKDPLIHDDSATDFVFTHVDAPNNSNKVKTAHDLEEELDLDVNKIRGNEGEAAMHGVYYDDTEYDYMQHLRDMGESSDAVYMEAHGGTVGSKDKRKKQGLDNALRGATVSNASHLLPKDLFPSEVELKRTYQDQQDIPDVLRGFQPEMDPRLREVLEALEDEAYVDSDEDIFGELTKGGEADENEFVGMKFEDGWESDATERPIPRAPAAVIAEEQSDVAAGDGEWMREFSKFKKTRKVLEDDLGSVVGGETISFGGTMSIGGTMSVGRRRRRREKKNTATASTGYSMSSSALFRTKGLTLLDDRFDKFEEQYNEEFEEPDGPLVIHTETRTDLNSIMDDFLENYNKGGKKPRVRRGKHQTGMDQLDEIRRGLGNNKIR